MATSRYRLWHFESAQTGVTDKTAILPCHEERWSAMLGSEPKIDREGGNEVNSKDFLDRIYRKVKQRME